MRTRRDEIKHYAYMVVRCSLRKLLFYMGGSIAEWLACWTQAQKGMGSNRSRDAVG